MKTNAIVSLTDEKYFDLLIELIDSIKKKPESKDTAICVLDAGTVSYTHLTLPTILLV